MLLGVLCTYAMGKNKAWPGQRLLAEEMGVSIRSVRRYIEELEQNLWIKSVQRGKKQSNLYILCEDKSVPSPKSDRTNLSHHRPDKSVPSIGSNELQEEMNLPKGKQRSAATSVEFEVMNSNIDQSFPRKRRYGDEGLNWLLDYYEFRMPNGFVEPEKWAKIFARHLKNKIGAGKLKEVIDWISEPDCWWFSRISGLKMLYYKRDQVLTAMQNSEKDKEKNKRAFIDGDKAYQNDRGEWMIIPRNGGQHLHFVGNLSEIVWR